MNRLLILSTLIDATFWSSLFTNLLAGLIFLLIYEKVFKNVVTFRKNKKFIGHYIHCDLTYNEIITDQKTHYSDITISFFEPNIINIVSSDFTDNKFRNWEGRIKVDPDTGLYGFGTYKYQNEILMGVHDILIIDDDTISFHLSYYKQSGRPYLLVKEKSGKVIKQNHC